MITAWRNKNSQSQMFLTFCSTFYYNITVRSHCSIPMKYNCHNKQKLFPYSVSNWLIPQVETPSFLCNMEIRSPRGQLAVKKQASCKRRDLQFVAFRGSSEELHVPRLDYCIVCNFRTLPVLADCHRPFGCTTSGSKKLRLQQRHQRIPLSADVADSNRHV